MTSLDIKLTICPVVVLPSAPLLSRNACNIQKNVYISYDFLPNRIQSYIGLFPHDWSEEKK